MTGVEEGSDIGGVIARSMLEATVRDEVVLRCVPVMVAPKLEGGSLRLGSEMVTVVGLLDNRDATAAERAR